MKRCINNINTNIKIINITIDNINFFLYYLNKKREINPKVGDENEL